MRMVGIDRKEMAGSVDGGVTGLNCHLGRGKIGSNQNVAVRNLPEWLSHVRLLIENNTLRKMSGQVGQVANLSVSIRTSRRLIPRS